MNGKKGILQRLARTVPGDYTLIRKGTCTFFGVKYEAYLDTRTGKVTSLDIRLREKDKSRLAFPYTYTDLFIDDDESLWIGTFNIGFLHYNPATKKNHPITFMR